MNVDPQHHILNIKEEEYPEKYRPLIRRLQSAILEPEMRKQMKIEDGILDEFEDMQRQILQQRQKTADAERGADEARQKTAEVERESGEAKKKVVHNLKAAGVPTEIIMQATGLNREEVDDV